MELSWISVKDSLPEITETLECGMVATERMLTFDIHGHQRMAYMVGENGVLDEWISACSEAWRLGSDVTHFIRPIPDPIPNLKQY